METVKTDCRLSKNSRMNELAVQICINIYFMSLCGYSGSEHFGHVK